MPFKNRRAYRRRQVVIDRKFQSQYMTIWLMVSVGLVVITLGTYLLTKNTAGGFASLNPVVLRLLGGMSVFILLFSLLMGILSVGMTHRIAGAAWRLDQSVQLLEKGNYEARFSLRRRDYLQSLSESLQSLQNALKDRHGILRDSAEKLDKFLADSDGRLTEAERLTVAFICDQLRQASPEVQSAPTAG